MDSVVDIVDEFRTRAYIDGRNAARDHLPDEVPAEYQSDSVASLHWTTGYYDVLLEESEYRFSV